MKALTPTNLLQLLLLRDAQDPSFEDRDLLIDCPGVNRLAVGVEANAIGDIVLRTKPDGAEPQNPLEPLVEELAQALYEAQQTLNEYGEGFPSEADITRANLAEKYRRK